MSSSNDSTLPPIALNAEFEYGKFVLSNLAAKRAKQLKDGAPPLVRIQSSHPLTVALAEIAAGKIRPIFEYKEPSVSDETSESEELKEKGIGKELGLLLPALEEVESFLDASLLDEEEIEEQEFSSIEDLLDEEELGEVERIEDSENLISLSDIESEEESEDDTK